MSRYVFRKQFKRRQFVATAALICLACHFQLCAQPIQIPVTGVGISGVFLDANGAVHLHDPNADEAQDARAKAIKAGVISKAVDKNENLCCISLPRLIPIIKELQLREKPIPDELRYLGGLTQIRYLFAYPDERELIIVGSCEPWDTTNPIEPIGKVTGHPIMQLDDLVAAMRTARNMRRGGENGGNFGCSINPEKGVADRVAKWAKAFANKPRPEKMPALAKAVGPQQIAFFNMHDNTRSAFVCVAADCKLKRFALGAEQSPVPGLGVAVEGSARVPDSHVWFDLSYDPILMSEDGFAFELKGQRLQVKAGEEEFNDKDATHKALNFAKQCTQKMPQLCASISAFADLRNVADLAMVATLIRLDKLDEKVKWDSLPVQAVIGWEVQTLPPPKTVDTVVTTANAALVHGGVSLGCETLLDPDLRKPDKKLTLKPVYDAVQKSIENNKVPVWTMP